MPPSVARAVPNQGENSVAKFLVFAGHIDSVSAVPVNLVYERGVPRLLDTKPYWGCMAQGALADWRKDGDPRRSLAHSILATALSVEVADYLAEDYEVFLRQFSSHPGYCVTSAGVEQFLTGWVVKDFFREGPPYVGPTKGGNQ